VGGGAKPGGQSDHQAFGGPRFAENGVLSKMAVMGIIIMLNFYFYLKNNPELSFFAFQ
jgi:hypothetical protein